MGHRYQGELGICGICSYIVLTSIGAFVNPDPSMERGEEFYPLTILSDKVYLPNRIVIGTLG